MPTVMVSAALAIFAYVAGHMGFEIHRRALHPGRRRAGGDLRRDRGRGPGFVVQRHPAEVFMGDVGALVTRRGDGHHRGDRASEIVLFIMGGLFVAEAMSVMVQVLYFKCTGGKRIFRMAPLHHHYELGGWRKPRSWSAFLDHDHARAVRPVHPVAVSNDGKR